MVDFIFPQFHNSTISPLLEAFVSDGPSVCPEGSTNTVLEHLFYSGTTNGAFALPQASEQYAVLRISVSGSGSGDLLVGGSYMPLVAPPQMRSAPQAAANLTDEQLRQHPFFLDFANSEMHTSSNGLIVATNYLYRAEMLAYAIPSESYAVGANPLPGRTPMVTYNPDGDLYRNHDMAILFTSGQSDLPQNGEDMDDKHHDWQHSTFVQRSYKRVHQLYKVIIHHIKECGNE